MNIIFHYDAGPWLEGHLQALAADGLMVSTCGEADEARFLALLPATDVLWHVLKPLRADHILAAPRLRLIQKIGVGVNTIDLEAARARDIPVCNMPGTNSRAVAEIASNAVPPGRVTPFTYKLKPIIKNEKSTTNKKIPV